MKSYLINGSILFSLSVILLLFTSSCEYDKRQPIDVGTLPDVVSFSIDVEPTFQANCTNCHNGTQPPDLTAENAYFDLSSGNYLDTENPEGSFLYKKISGTGSMASNADDYQRAIILKWIQQGAQDN